MNLPMIPKSTHPKETFDRLARRALFGFIMTFIISRIMVFLISGVRTGFIVDQVAEVLMIPKSSIEPAPQLSTEQSLLLSRMANLEKQKRMVQLLDPPHLMEQKELVALAAVTG